MELKNNGRRKLRGLINDRNKQFTYGLVNVLVTLTVVLLINSILIYKINSISNLCIQMGGDVQISSTIELVDYLIWASVFATLVIGGVGFFFILTLTHRFYGPMVPIQQHLEKMIAGDLSGQVQLRKDDEFQNIADQLNRLTEALKNKDAKKE